MSGKPPPARQSSTAESQCASFRTIASTCLVASRNGISKRVSDLTGYFLQRLQDGDAPLPCSEQSSGLRQPLIVPPRPFSPGPCCCLPLRKSSCYFEVQRTEILTSLRYTPITKRSVSVRGRVPTFVYLRRTGTRIIDSKGLSGQAHNRTTHGAPTEKRREWKNRAGLRRSELG